ncbi:MAG: prepilin-type N-terminal cleavage/methylation domain-containing protein, partial [Candidatus Hydrogenedentes bacterium]|nr:prepilin-type N-terminal cleavage/methylation domain-containing protein [Candidatus Hydrogenedentota bacterium]
MDSKERAARAGKRRRLKEIGTMKRAYGFTLVELLVVIAI